MLKSLNKWFRIRHLEACIYRMCTPENAEKNAPLINSMRAEISALEGSQDVMKYAQEQTLSHWDKSIEKAKSFLQLMKSTQEIVEAMKMFGVVASAGNQERKNNPAESIAEK